MAVKKCNTCHKTKPEYKFMHLVGKVKSGEIRKYRSNKCRACTRGKTVNKKQDKERLGFFNVTAVEDWIF